MTETPEKTIDLAILEEMFERIVETTDWDVTGELLWGYFFTHHEPELLEEAKDVLVDGGYRFIRIFISEGDEPEEPDTYWLHVEKAEIHTPHSLDQRNDELSRFAQKFGLATYDGMDVGPVEDMN